MKIVSFQLASKYPDNISRLLDNLEETAADKSSFEVLVKVDVEDPEMCRRMEREARTRPFRVHPLVSPRRKGYEDLWIALNELFTLTDPEAYFVCCINDELSLAAPGWDTVLQRYVGLYPDHIFRLKTSRFKLRNYYDLWECGYAPEGLGFYTRRWLEIVGGWNPCFGPDNSQQYIAYYLGLANFPSIYQFNRDVPIYGIEWLGEGVGVNLTPQEQMRRNAINFRLWFRQVSHPMQEELSRRARLLQAHIVNSEFFDNAGQISEERHRKTLIIRDARTKRLLYILPYRISAIKLFLGNLRRTLRFGYFGGGGRPAWNIVPVAVAELWIVRSATLRSIGRPVRAALSFVWRAFVLRAVIYTARTFQRFTRSNHRIRQQHGSTAMSFERPWSVQILRAIFEDMQTLGFLRLVRKIAWAWRMKDLRWILVLESIKKDLRGPL